jgi:hypothetical protein
MSDFEKVNIWPKDEAFRRLLEAILIFKDLHGSYDTTKFLQQEITREIVVREYHAGRKEVAAAEVAAQRAAVLLATAIEALGFYADPDNYKMRNGQPSVVIKDKGHLASEALATISGVDVAEDPEEGE